MVGMPFIGGSQGRFMFPAQHSFQPCLEASGSKLSENTLTTKAVLFFASESA